MAQSVAVSHKPAVRVNLVGSFVKVPALVIQPKGWTYRWMRLLRIDGNEIAVATFAAGKNHVIPIPGGKLPEVMDGWTSRATEGMLIFPQLPQQEEGFGYVMSFDPSPVQLYHLKLAVWRANENTRQWIRSSLKRKEGYGTIEWYREGKLCRLWVVAPGEEANPYLELEGFNELMNTEPDLAHEEIELRTTAKPNLTAALKGTDRFYHFRVAGKGISSVKFQRYDGQLYYMAWAREGELTVYAGEEQVLQSADAVVLKTTDPAA